MESDTSILVVIIPDQNRQVDEEHKKYGEKIINLLKDANIDANFDIRDTYLARWKYRQWEEQGYILITYGSRDMADNRVTMRPPVNKTEQHRVLLSLNDPSQMILQIKQWLE